MSSRALRKLQGNDLIVAKGQENELSDEPDVVQSKPKKNKKKKKAEIENPFDLLNDDDGGGEDGGQESEDNDVEPEPEPEAEPIEKTSKKKKKKKKKKAKDRTSDENATKVTENEDEIDASIREVNRILNNGNIGEGDIDLPSTEDSVGYNALSKALLTVEHNNTGEGDIDLPSTEDSVGYNALSKALLTIEHKNLNPDNELKRIFGSRVLRDEAPRRRGQTRRRQKTSWMATPKDSWPPIGRVGLSMGLKETRDGSQYFVFEHSHQYQQVQFQFYEAVESLNPENIANILQLQPYHNDALLQLSEVFHMSEDNNMAAELIERALYSMEMAAHPLFNLTTGTCRLDYKNRENRSMHLALFKHINFLGNRGCNRTALEFCKLLLSLSPDDDPLCALLMIDFYALRSAQYDFLVRLYDEWEAHRNLSQLPNFAFSVPLAKFQLSKDGDTSKADDLLQTALLMFPSVLVPLLDKCGVQGDNSISHDFFQTAALSEPTALKQLVALYVGRCHACWKIPDVVTWLERNVKTALERVTKNDPVIEDYKIKRQSRYKGTPRNIYRHILVSEIPTATATLPQDIASVVLSYDPLPPLNSVEAYTRPTRPNRAQTNGGFSMFLRSLMPNFNPNEPAPEEGAEGGANGQNLRNGVGALMDAMRDLLNNIRMVDHPVENNGDDPEQDLEEWD